MYDTECCKTSLTLVAFTNLTGWVQSSYVMCHFWFSDSLFNLVLQTLVSQEPLQVYNARIVLAFQLLFVFWYISILFPSNRF